MLSKFELGHRDLSEQAFDRLVHAVTEALNEARVGAERVRVRDTARQKQITSLAIRAMPPGSLARLSDLKNLVGSSSAVAETLPSDSETSRLTRLVAAQERIIELQGKIIANQKSLIEALERFAAEQDEEIDEIEKKLADHVRLLALESEALGLRDDLKDQIVVPEKKES
jgi:uncharacterized coiled-coil protein SlyX